MIREQYPFFQLDTEHTSYCFRVTETGHLEHLHYGRKKKSPRERILQNHLRYLQKNMLLHRGIPMYMTKSIRNFPWRIYGLRCLLTEREISENLLWKSCMEMAALLPIFAMKKSGNYEGKGGVSDAAGVL